MAEQIISKTSLWVGNHDTVIHNIITYLQGIYCPSHCTICLTCKQIAGKQFHDICWLNPLNDSYKIEELSTIEHITSYTRDSRTPYFFIIDYAELLSIPCSNKLLKLLEDAPSGYHFILSTNRELAILPTIRSRCFIYQSNNNSKALSEISPAYASSFVSFFTTDYVGDIKQFLIIFDTHKSSSEEEIVSLCHHLLKHLLALYKTKEEKQQKIILDRIEYIKTILTKGIPPGSTPLVLRSLYLEWNRNIIK